LFRAFRVVIGTLGVFNLLLLLVAVIWTFREKADVLAAEAPVA
jgi:hypothetical protein